MVIGKKGRVLLVYKSLCFVLDWLLYLCLRTFVERGNPVLVCAVAFTYTEVLGRRVKVGVYFRAFGFEA